MRNGINTSAISELVHEISETPREAQIRFASRVEGLAPGHATATMLPTRAGTIRIPRRFGFPIKLGGRAPFRTPAPEQFAVTAVGACVLLTFVYGSASKGITLSSVSLRVDADLHRHDERVAFTKLRYTLDVDADATEEALLENMRSVSCLSPNHRTAVETNTITIQSDADDVLSIVRAVGELPESQHCERLSSVLTWEYGAQLSVEMLSPGQIRGFKVGVDQHKQYLGLDKSPNPQEYLLSALGADILANYGGDISRHGLSLSGRVDLRGIMNVEPEIPVRVTKIRVDHHHSMDHEALTRAVRRSAIAGLICNPTEVSIDVNVRGNHLQTLSGGIDVAAWRLAQATG